MNAELLSWVNQLFALGTIALQIGLVALLIGFLFFKDKLTTVFSFLAKHGLTLAFIAALVSMLGSLFYSNIAGFEPCVLCWYQRIFMYPLVIILGIAVAKKNHQIIDYVIALPVIGFLIAAYHSYLYYLSSTGCALSGRGVSCTQRYVFEYGYITIPMMALTVFAVIIVLLMMARPKTHDARS